MYSNAVKIVSSHFALGRRAWSNISQAMLKTLTYSEVTEKLKDPKTILLDVREVSELQTDGRIEGSKNVPVGQVATAFKMTDSDFKETYGFSKPPQSAQVVVHCKAGVRAGNAAKILSENGYSNVLVYDGILDWVKQGGKVLK